MVANSVICAIHLYHVLAWKLEPADIMHHALFVVVLCGLAIPFKQTMGAANNFGCFFVSMGCVRTRARSVCVSIFAPRAAAAAGGLLLIEKRSMVLDNPCA
jgi:hypothetical protein